MVFNIDTQLGVDTLQLIKSTIKYLMKKAHSTIIERQDRQTSF